MLNGKIYIIGGRDNSENISTVEEYNPETNTCTQKASMNEVRFEHTTKVLNGKIYAIGGQNRATVEEYNQETNTWTQKTSMNKARYGHTTEVLNGKIYVIGGKNGSTTLSTVEEYTPSTNIAINKTSLGIVVGNSDTLIATTTPVSIGIIWKTSDELVATVDQNGKVIAVSEGQATITATTADGSNLSASCAVNVTKETEPTKPEDASNIVNIARVKGNNTNNASGSVSIIFKGVAETQLSVVKTADVESVYVGDTFMYTIVVTNTSSQTAKAVIINDSAPNHIQFTVGGITTTQGKVAPSSTSSNIVVNVGDILPSGTVTITIPATVVL